MSHDRTGVDACHAMTTALPHSKHDELTELLQKAAGRFGREVRMIASADPEMAESRTTEVENMRRRLKQGGYDVDPRLVAAAILDRLTAGGVAPSGRKRSM
jgi:anti-sigma28 factor (negative regulator of flagellin synthesis)